MRGDDGENALAEATRQVKEASNFMVMVVLDAVS